MNKRNKIILISLLSTIFVLVLVIGITKSFMKPIEEGGNITEVSLNSCAKIKLTSTSNVNLSSSYPMSRNRGLQTTPYKFTVTSYCDSYVGFNLYIATLSTNTIDAKYVRYILTESGTKNVIQEGILSSAETAETDFTDTEKTELNTGIKGTYNTIYKIYNDKIPLKGSNSYDLYLFLDGDTADNTTMGKTFKAGIAVKSYDREADPTLASYIISQYTGTQGENGLYFHNGTIKDTDGNIIDAEDGSYRYAGASNEVKNYICLGSSETVCPDDNLYRIIGIFGEENHGVKNQKLVKVIKNETYGSYKWNATNNNEWSNSSLNITLNSTFKTEKLLGIEDVIAEVSWRVSGTYSSTVTAKTFYTLEITNATKRYTSKIGLMYASDYGFATTPDYWITNLNSYNSESNAYKKNWLHLDDTEWTITSDDSSSSSGAWYVISDGSVNVYFTVVATYTVRPSFYLTSSVQYESGDGTISNPIRLKI